MRLPQRSLRCQPPLPPITPPAFVCHAMRQTSNGPRDAAGVQQNFSKPLENQSPFPAPTKTAFRNHASTKSGISRRPTSANAATRNGSSPSMQDAMLRGSPVLKSRAQPRPATRFTFNRCVITHLLPYCARNSTYEGGGGGGGGGQPRPPEVVEISPHWSASHQRKCSTSTPARLRHASSFDLDLEPLHQPGTDR